MEDKLDAFRRRLHGTDKPPKEKMRVRDWASLAMAGSALLISAATAYFNILRESDDVSLLIKYPPFVTVDDDDDNRFVAETTHTIAFVNSGNRPATVFGLSVTFNQDIGDPELPCVDESVSELQFGDEPFVLKPGEIVSRQMTLLPPKNGPWLGAAQSKSNGRISLPVTKENLTREVYWFRTCLSFVIVPPSGTWAVGDIQLYEAELPKERGRLRRHTMKVGAEPIVLLRRSNNWLSRGANYFVSYNPPRQ